MIVNRFPITYEELLFGSHSSTPLPTTSPRLKSARSKNEQKNANEKEKNVDI